MSAPRPSAERFALHHGAVALPQGLLWLESARTLVAADAHLAYEEVIGGALPLWSTAESTHALLLAARRMQARELVLLGDVIHGSRMSEGAARTVIAALDLLRAEMRVTLVAGNHEGRSRGAAVLGATEEAIERDGWMLVHGDRPIVAPRTIVGHLHPSLPLGGGAHVPAFLASARTIVVPALTPYSNGLNVLSREAVAALRTLEAEPNALHVVASTPDRVFPFGALGALRATLRAGTGARPQRYRHALRPDRP